MFSWWPFKIKDKKPITFELKRKRYIEDNAKKNDSEVDKIFFDQKNIEQNRSNIAGIH